MGAADRVQHRLFACLFLCVSIIGECECESESSLSRVTRAMCGREPRRWGVLLRSPDDFFNFDVV